MDQNLFQSCNSTKAFTSIKKLLTKGPIAPKMNRSRLSVCVCLCVWERERDRERERKPDRQKIIAQEPKKVW